jgi:hypothetical protein
MAVLLLILYLLDGRGYLVQSVHATPEACQEAGEKELINLSDRAIVLAAMCGPIEAQEVKKD